MKLPSLPDLRFLLAGTGYDIITHNTCPAHKYALVRRKPSGPALVMVRYSNIAHVYHCPVAADAFDTAAQYQDDHNLAAHLRMIASNIRERAGVGA